MSCRVSLVSLFVGLLTLSGASQAGAQYPDATRRLPYAETAPGGPADASPTADASPMTAWFDPEIWENSIELGINGSEGNTQRLSFRTGSNLRRTTDTSVLAIDITYARTTANSIETQNNALLAVRHDWLFGESPWTVFAATTLEYDRFKAFDLRTAVNAGVGYQFIKNDATKLVGRFGSGFSREIGGPDDSYVPEAVLGIEFEHQLTKRQKLIAKSDFFPDWSDFAIYRIETTVGWEVLLDEEANLSLKVGVIDRYDSTPNGRKHNDFDYSLLLIWKL